MNSISIKVIAIIIFVAAMISNLSPMAIFPALAGDVQKALPPGPNTGSIPWATIPGADPFHFLSNSQGAQKELKLTEDQLKELHEADRLFRSRMRELTFQPKTPETQEKMMLHMEAARNGLSRILTQPQLERLLQLLLQIQGACPITREPRLTSILQLSDQQVDAINNICQLEVKMRQEKMRSNQTQRPGTTKAGEPPSCKAIVAELVRMQQIRQEIDNQVIALFSEEQKKLYAEAQGTPFNFDQDRLAHCRP